MEKTQAAFFRCLEKLLCTTISLSLISVIFPTKKALSKLISSLFIQMDGVDVLLINKDVKVKRA